MRRLATSLLLAAAFLPTALAVVFASQDWEAIRCAARCGHAVSSGAVCCPADSDGASLKTCPADDAIAVRAVAPAMLAAAIVLPLPVAHEPAPVPASARLLDAVVPPPDPVPLALS